ncbi:cyclic GMP-AMP synthase-like receptor isoform X3 [Zeugodacus cucurbitae]|uniref:cyclic GMP-AMP synthase-like receptor isoform X3 n=1 Tax=Zeugodacus cucurbitae TaxID=28588 RepID=UPI0023D9207E|nr:cyclic GMP-AMP synthase-like receptor isoform X3 [Zeugodacus cucurbitae]
MNQELTVLQVNLHKSKIASAELLLNLEKGGYDVALVQEPWIASGNVVAGLKSPNYTTYTPSVTNKVRTAVLVSKKLYSHVNLNLSTDDLTVVAVKDCRDELILLASCYLPHDGEAPTAELQRLVATSSRRKQSLVVGADANAHHTIWGSRDINAIGSYADNLKVKYPDEYDLVFRLKLPEGKRIQVVKDEEIPGNVKIDLSEVLKVIAKQTQHLNTYNRLKKTVTDEGLLSLKLLQSWLESCFTKALDSINKKITHDGITSPLSYSKQGPAHTIYVKVPYTYSVDFVPAIVLISTKAILPTISKDWDAIPKPLKFLPSDTSFRASYDSLENEIIKDKNNLKNALRIMKKYRDIHTNLYNLKSYYIKTLFLWRASKEPSTFWNKPISFVVSQLFIDLKSSLEKCELPFYWDHKLNLYERIGQNGLDSMRTCVASTVAILDKYPKQKDRTENHDLKIYKLFPKTTHLTTSRRRN